MIANINRIIIFFLFSTIAFAIGWTINKTAKELTNKVYPNVYIDHISFGYKTQKEIIDFFQEKNKKLKSVKIFVFFQNQPIATFSGETLNLAYNGETTATRAYLIGRSPHFLSRIYQQMASFFRWQRFEFESQIEYDKNLIEEFINQIEEKYNKPAKNALFTFSQGRVTAFRKEEKGLEILSKQFKENFDKTIQDLKNKTENKRIILKSKIIEPEITLKKANSFGIEELLAVGKSDFSHSIPERIHNIILASSKFNGVLIPKNKILSFNETVGDISSLTGYKPAYIIKQGKTVLGDGGGVCQVSTTLFRAALQAGLPIIERTPHAYRVSYYENDSKPGFDATVFAPHVDLKIKNDTPAHILIQTEVDKEKNLLFFKLFGKKDNRKIEISPVSLWDVIPPPPPVYQDDPTLKKGVVKQIDFAAWGAKASFTYKVIKDGKTIFEKEFFSSYRPWQAVFLVGTGN